MQSRQKSITLMLMKVSIFTKFMLALFASISFLLIPQMASQARAESYLFYYENDDVQEIRDAVYGNTTFNSIEGLRSTAVWVKDFRGQSKPQGFQFDSVSKNTRELVYKFSYECRGNDTSSGTQINYTINLRAYVKITLGPPTSWDQQGNIPGQIRLADSTGSDRYIDPSCLPAGVDYNSSKNVNFANYQRTNKSNWPGVTSTTNQSVSQTEEQNRTNPADQEDEPKCTTEGGFGWLVCGLINLFQEIVTFVETKLISPMFQVDPLSFKTGSDNPQYAAWNVMRGIANVFFVLIFMVVIFANLFSIDAYNVKKILPKLVVAAILIQMSFVIMAAAIDVTNILGAGLKELAISVMPEVKYMAGTEEKVITGFTILGAGAIIGFALTAKIAAVGIISAALPMVIGIIAVMLVLVLRQVLLVLLVLTAPIAIASMALPNTENLFRKWMDLFIRLLLMYPMIILLFAAGRIAAFSALSVDAAGVIEGLGPIVALLCLALPLLAVPFTFSWAGGLMKTVSKGVFKLSGQASKSAQNSDWNKNRVEERKNRALRDFNPDPGYNLLRRRSNKIAGGGFFRNSSATRRRLGNAQEKLFSGDEKALERQFETDSRRENFDRNSVLENIVKGEAPGYKHDQQSVNFAVKKLAQSGQYKKLRELKNAPGGTGTMVKDAIGQNWETIHKAAPDLTTGKFDYLDTMPEGDLKNLHYSTLEAYVDQPNLNQAEKDRRMNNLGRIVTQVGTDDRYKRDVNAELVGGIRHLAVQGKLGNYNQSVLNITTPVQTAPPAPGQLADNRARFV